MTWTRMAVMTVMASAALGCGDKKDSPKEPPEKTGSATGATTGAGSGTAAKTPADAGAAVSADGQAKLLATCQSSCLLLSEHKLSALVGKGYCKVCGGVLPEACTEPNPFSSDNCDQFDYQRNCIYAANGYKFKKKKWQDTFGKTDWYKVDDNFDEKNLTILETGNIRALRNRTSVCRGKSLGKVSPKDIEIVKKLFAQKKSKKLKLPKRVYTDGQKVKAEAFLEFFNTEGLFTLKKHTPISYSEWGPGGDFDRKKFRNINVATGAPGPDCEGDGEECEGFEWLDILIDVDGNIVALGVGAAACPFVYAAAGDAELVKVGEILRNRSRRSLETSQHLTLPDRTSCEATVRVRVAEEKRERTYLDDIALRVGDTLLAPVQCEDAGARFCDDDGRYHVISQGESLDLVFSIPRSRRCEPARVVANGYYVPVSSGVP